MTRNSTLRIKRITYHYDAFHPKLDFDQREMLAREHMNWLIVHYGARWYQFRRIHRRGSFSYGKIIGRNGGHHSIHPREENA